MQRKYKNKLDKYFRMCYFNKWKSFGCQGRASMLKKK